MSKKVMVKVEDIGPLALFCGWKGDELELELDGERFFIPERLTEFVGDPVRHNRPHSAGNGS